MQKMTHKVKKIISGGQKGADRAALEVAKFDLGLETGGYAPKDYMTEDGPDETLAGFGIVCLQSEKYPPRTMANVDNSDGTVAFRLKASSGTDRTIGYAQTGRWIEGEIRSMDIKETGNKPVCVIDDMSNEQAAANVIRKFLADNNIVVLNVAGHRESTAPVQDFAERVKNVLKLALQ